MSGCASPASNCADFADQVGECAGIRRVQEHRRIFGEVADDLGERGACPVRIGSGDPHLRISGPVRQYDGKCRLKHPRTLPRPRTARNRLSQCAVRVDTELNDAGVGIPSGPGITCDRVAPVPRRGIRAVDIQPVRQYDSCRVNSGVRCPGVPSISRFQRA